MFNASPQTHSSLTVNDFTLPFKSPISTATSPLASLVCSSRTGQYPRRSEPQQRTAKNQPFERSTSAVAELTGKLTVSFMVNPANAGTVTTRQWHRRRAPFF